MRNEVKKRSSNDKKGSIDPFSPAIAQPTSRKQELNMRRLLGYLLFVGKFLPNVLTFSGGQVHVCLRGVIEQHSVSYFFRFLAIWIR